MAEHGVPVERVINAGGIPQNNAVLNQIYAGVLGKPVLVPDGTPTSLGSGIFAMLAAGVFRTIEEAQKAICLPYRSYSPQPKSVAVYNELYPLYRKAYFALGRSDAAATPLGMVLPELRRIAAATRLDPIPLRSVRTAGYKIKRCGSPAVWACDATAFPDFVDK
jgi:L-ribulokinase